jgi:hypothetical protein
MSKIFAHRSPIPRVLQRFCSLSFLNGSNVEREGSTLQSLLLNNGLPDQPIVLVEPHRSYHGVWRIKFSYDDSEPLSMDVQQASELAISLHQMDEDDLACEIDEAVGRARHYETM